MTPPITYEVAMPAPATHLFEVRMTVPNPPERLELVMPAWTPGSYKIRDFARHVQDFRAAAADRPLAAAKLDKNTYVVDCEGAAEVQVSYRVYADELTVRTSHLDDRHGFFNGTNLFFFVRGRTERPLRLVVHPPAGWQVFTGLAPDPAPGPAGTAAFLAPDYDRLADAPVECGPHQAIVFDVGGKPHRMVMAGSGNYEPARLQEDAAAICRAEVALFEEQPYDDYTFIVVLPSNGQGGLEHLNSTALMVPRYGFRPRDRYVDFLSLCAHEYFHLWNGKRLRPEGLGPFDYEREVYTRSLWVVEGWTSYYDKLVLRRAGLIPARTLLEKLAKAWNSLQETPGRSAQSLSESSFDTWIKFYQRSAHSLNSSVSYYEKGMLVALLLDLEIRRRTSGKRSLDHVLRALWRQFGALARPYAEADPRRVAEQIAGADLQDFFASYVDGTVELDMAAALASSGLRVVPDIPKEDAEFPGDRPWLGLRSKTENGRLLVGEVVEGGPAWRDGLNAGDEILALDGCRISEASMKSRLAEYELGSRVSVTVFRDDLLRTLKITLSEKAPLRVKFEPDPEADSAARGLYEGWMEEPFPATIPTRQAVP